MRSSFCILFLCLNGIVFGQADSVKNKRVLKTSKYQGVYSYGTKPENGAGQITIYPETDSTVLFFIDICRAGDLSIGQTYSRLKISEGQGMYYSNEDGGNGCKWQVTINKGLLTIKTLDNAYDCGFGHGVGANGIYKQKSHKRCEYFIDGHGDKIYFQKTSPENYLK
jgi:hypothetical protein